MEWCFSIFSDSVCIISYIYIYILMFDTTVKTSVAARIKFIHVNYIVFTYRY